MCGKWKENILDESSVDGVTSLNRRTRFTGRGAGKLRGVQIHPSLSDPVNKSEIVLAQQSKVITRQRCLISTKNWML